MNTVWVATRWHQSKILLTEAYLKPGRVFTVDSGYLDATDDNRTAHLGKLLGFSSDLELLKQTLGIEDYEEVRVVPARGSFGT